MIVCCLLLLLQNPSALSDRALALAQEKRYAEAEKLWREALQIAPDYFPALFNFGYMQFSQGNYTQAQPLLESAIKAQPRSFEAQYLLGQVLVMQDRREEGLRRWRAALQIQPSNLKLIQVMIVEYEKGRYYAEAATLARRALDRDPRDLNLYLLAIHAFQNVRDMDAGLATARRAVEQFPGSARANFEYAFHLQRAGGLSGSVKYLNQAMTIDPKYEEPFFFYGDLLVTEGRDEEAIRYLTKAIENRAGYLQAHLSLAKAWMHLEKWPAAIQALHEAARIDPTHPEPHLLLSRIYFRTGDETRAAREKEISLRLRRENPLALEAEQGREFPRNE